MLFESAYSFLIFYRFMGVVIVLVWAWALDMWIFKRFRINFRLLLGVSVTLAFCFEFGQRRQLRNGRLGT